MNKKLKKIFLFFSIVFLLISVHMWYMYVNYFSNSKIIKWWTIIQWTTQKINYLPYTSFTKDDIFYQSLIFDKCAQSSGINIIDRICKIDSKDFKNFTVKFNPNYTGKRSDWEPITIDDIFFTYNNIIKNNLLQIPDLSAYSNLNIIKTNNTISIKFPLASIDNKLFFDNYILPSHILTWKNLAYYQTEFANKLVTNSCALIQKNNVDLNSIIFDLSKCDNYSKQYFQIKKFDDTQRLTNELNNQKSIVDFVNESNLVWNFSWYDKYNYDTSKFLVMFMNVSNVNSDIRKNLYKFIKTLNIKNFDNYNSNIFVADPNGQNLKQALAKTWNMTTINSWNKLITDLKLPILTKSIYIYGSNKYKTYQINSVPDTWFPINFKFDTWYVRIWISANWWWKYNLSTYNSGSRTASYNISSKFNNLIKWINYYTIRWYAIDNTEKPIKLLTIKLHNGSQIITNQVTVIKKNKFKIIYTKNDLINKYISWLQDAFIAEWINSYFSFEWYDNISELNGKINNNDYDIVFKMYDFGNKYDLSMFFWDNKIINPSGYKNPTTQQNISDYLLWNKSLKSDIQKVYQSEYPFVIISKDKWTIHVKSWSQISWFVNNLLDADLRRNQLINQYKPTRKPVIDSTVLDINKLIKFIKDNL